MMNMQLNFNIQINRVFCMTLKQVKRIEILFSFTDCLQRSHTMKITTGLNHNVC